MHPSVGDGMCEHVHLRSMHGALPTLLRFTRWTPVPRHLHPSPSSRRHLAARAFEAYLAGPREPVGLELFIHGVYYISASHTLRLSLLPSCFSFVILTFPSSVISNFYTTLPLKPPFHLLTPQAKVLHVISAATATASPPKPHTTTKKLPFAIRSACSA